MPREFRDLLTKIKPVKDTLLHLVEEDVIGHYFKYYRHYHTFDEHILPGLHLLKYLNSIKRLIEQKELVELAWWYHDVIYIPGSSHNEVLSADKARFDCIQLGFGETIANTVDTLVTATRHSGTRIWTTQDEKIIHDLDLVVLGSEPKDYDRYAKLIRKEYSFASEEDFTRGRLHILDDFVGGDCREISANQRKDIYLTEYFQDRYEKRALENLYREMNTLRDKLSCFNKG